MPITRRKINDHDVLERNTNFLYDKMIELKWRLIFLK